MREKWRGLWKIMYANSKYARYLCEIDRESFVWFFKKEREI